jgi:hypothetical protein
LHWEAGAAIGRQTLEEIVREPVLFVVDYTDGLRVNLFTLAAQPVDGQTRRHEYRDGRRAASAVCKQNKPTPIQFDWQMKGLKTWFLPADFRPAEPAAGQRHAGCALISKGWRHCCRRRS